MPATGGGVAGGHETHSGVRHKHQLEPLSSAAKRYEPDLTGTQSDRTVYSHEHRRWLTAVEASGGMYQPDMVASYNRGGVYQSWGTGHSAPETVAKEHEIKAVLGKLPEFSAEWPEAVQLEWFRTIAKVSESLK